MDIKALKLDEDCLLALEELQQAVAINENLTLHPTQSMKELVDMIEVCLRSSSTEVNFSLLTFIALLTERQRAFFKSVGTDLGQAKKIVIKERMLSYRGAKLGRKVEAKPVDTTSGDSAPEELLAGTHRGKKKIIYRGQEKWI
ncbi:hypothetical protein TDB9533_04727 [Thalassocella blandensis]|nr:hypothetical protein TDB9533_04727 [Thalassocella blandensis]